MSWAQSFFSNQHYPPPKILGMRLEVSLRIPVNREEALTCADQPKPLAVSLNLCLQDDKNCSGE
jgi:hypothetical protein